jgi:hypothetical protein
MEFVLPGFKFFVYVGIGMIVLGLLVLLGIFKGSRSPLNYILGGLICIVMGIFFLTNKMTGSIVVSPDQLTLKAALTKTQVIPDDAIKKAWIEDLRDSEWRPVRKQSGTAIGSIRTGWFSLQNGRKAYLILQGDRALCIEAEQPHVFLIGLEEFDLFLNQAKAEMPVLQNFIQ